MNIITRRIECGTAGRVVVSICALLILWPALPLLAQSEEAPERRIDLREVETLSQRAEGDTTLPEDLRKRIVELYDGAINKLQAAAADVARAADYERERAGVGRLVEALRAELNRIEPRPRVDLPDGTTAERAELSLARERSRLEAHRSALRDVERLSGERSAARNEISRRLGMLDQTIDALSDDLRVATERAIHPQLKEATRISLLARREGAVREIDALRARLSLLDARGALIPWEIDQAQRRVARSEHVVNVLRSAARELRRREAEHSLERVRKQCSEAAETIEALAGIAAETEELAALLWGPEGVLVTVETAAGDVVATRKNLTDLDRFEQVTRRQFEAVGYRGSVTRWWPEIPEEFPKPEDVLTVIQRLQERIPEVQHRQIRFEQQRSRAREVQDRALLDLRMESEDKATPEQMRRARNLFNTRRDLLDRLMQLYGRYSNQLVELEALLQSLLEERQEFQAYLYERILWVRSVPRPVIPRPGDLRDAFVWLNSPGHWWAALRALGTGIRNAPGVSLIIAIAFGLLLGTRRRMRGRLGRLATRLETPETDSYRVTVEALIHTIGLAAPLPLALYIGSQVILRAEAGPILFAVGSALSYLASIAALLELTRQIAAPDGLARHFGWPSGTAGMLYGRLLKISGVFLPLIYVAIFFGMAGFRLSSPVDLRLYNNTLGRLAFITAMLFLGGALANHFRPRMRRASTHATGSARPFRFQVLAYPVSILATIVPAALAVVGYYITGYLLAYQMLQTVWLLLGLLVLGGMLSRWNVTTHRDDSHSAALPAGYSAPGESGPLRTAQVRELFRFVLIVVAALGLYGVWSEAIPTVQLVKRVQIWPRIVLIEGTREGAASAGVDAGGEPEPGTAEKTGDGDEGAIAIPPGMPAPSSGVGVATGAPPGRATLTLWQLLQSLLAFVVTWMLVKNVPGLLELLLRRRTGLESGVRIALGTLVRYTIMILGVSVALGLLGVTWGRIQWLAAALTFGLAFGLQEIVANFISGLILLVERPIRVGDAVTIGNLMGRVTRIQIRATTITLWDRSEMIVPNKEFITSKLINWTLSDSKRRISIPLRIAYGADLQKVKDLLLGIAGKHPEVLADPAPSALVLDFGDDAIKFEFRVFVDFGVGEKTKDDLQMSINRVFREQGIELALPQLRIQLPAGKGGLPAESDTTPEGSPGSGGSRGSGESPA